MVMALFGDYRDPTTMLSYFSKKEDTDKVRTRLIKQSQKAAKFHKKLIEKDFL